MTPGAEGSDRVTHAEFRALLEAHPLFVQAEPEPEGTVTLTFLGEGAVARARAAQELPPAAAGAEQAVSGTRQRRPERGRGPGGPLPELTCGRC